MWFTTKFKISLEQSLISLTILCYFAVRPTVIETDVYVNSIGPVDPINMVSKNCCNTGFLSVCLTGEWLNVWFMIAYCEVIVLRLQLLLYRLVCQYGTKHFHLGRESLHWGKMTLSDWPRCKCVWRIFLIKDRCGRTKPTAHFG